MKKVCLLLIGLLFLMYGYSQSIAFQESFEGSFHTMISTSESGINGWTVTNTLSSDSAKSIWTPVGTNDSIYLTSPSFSCLNQYYIILEFDQIAKIHYLDAAIIQVSIDNGLNWQTITSGYEGNGIYQTSLGFRFNSSSYTNWLNTNNTATPDSSWWHHEKFDISSYVSNQSQVKIRFMLTDFTNGGGANGNYGWLIDDIKVSVSVSELIPPVVSFLPIMPMDTIFSPGPYRVKVKATDNSGISSVTLFYRTSDSISGNLPMQLVSADTFSAEIPLLGFGRKIYYYAKAHDNSIAQNFDSTSELSFYSQYAPGGSVIIGNGINGCTYPFSQFASDCRTQALYLSSEINNGSVLTGEISAFGFQVESSYGQMYHNFNVKIKPTTQSTLTGFDLSSGWITVYSGDFVLPYNGLIQFTLPNPFPWDGSSNLLIDMCFDNAYPVGFVNIVGTHISGKLWKQDGTAPSDVGCTFSIGNSFHSRPNLYLNLQPYQVTGDIGIGEINSPSGHIVANQAVPISVRLKNFGIDPILSAVVKWRFDSIQQNDYAFSGNLFPDSTSADIVLGTKTISSGIHSLEVWTENPNNYSDLNLTNDTMKLVFYGCDSLLNGTYSIGDTATGFATLTHAVNHLQNCGVSGPVVFNLEPGVYNEQIFLSSIYGSSEINTITFQSATGDSTDVIITSDANYLSDNYVVKLDGVSNIHFKSLTLKSLDNYFSKVIHVRNESNNISFRNCIVQSAYPQTDSDPRGNLVHVENFAGDSLVIAHSVLVNGTNGIWVQADVLSNGCRFESNEIINCYGTMLYVQNLNNPVISKNEIETNSDYSNFVGIQLSNCSGNATVNGNKITTFNTPNATGIYFYESLFDTVNLADCFNNMVDLYVNSSSSTYASGIYVYSSSNIDILFNTVNLRGYKPYSATIFFSQLNGNNIIENIRIRNNVFTQNAVGSLIVYYPIQVSEIISDYNSFYRLNSQKSFAPACANLVEWQIKRNKDLHSDTLNPQYQGLFDLHITNSMMNGLGYFVSKVPVDIDGESRNTIHPDRGADEFDPVSCDIAVISVENLGGCGLDTSETITVLLKNVGNDSIINNLSVSYEIAGSLNPITEQINDPIAPLDTFAYSFQAKANLSVANFLKDSTFTIKFYAHYLCDTNYSNDTLISYFISKYTPNPPIISDDTIPYATSDTLYNNAGIAFWYDSDSSLIPLTIDSVFITPPIFDSTRFWVSHRVFLDHTAYSIGSVYSYTNSSPCPYGPSEKNRREQYLIHASELKSEGFEAGYIESIAFNIHNIYYQPNFQSFEIYMGETNSVDLNQWESGLKQVYSTNGSLGLTAGWNTHQFFSSFFWDGTSNIVIQICLTSTNSGSNASMYYQQTQNYSSLYYTSYSNTNICNVTSRTRKKTRPFIRLGMKTTSCESPRSSFNIYVDSFPQIDAGLIRLFYSSSDSFPAGTAQPLKAILKNYGANNLTSVKIAYMLDDIVKDTFIWNGNLALSQTDTVNLGFLFPSGGIHKAKAFTFSPNNQNDIYSYNDSSFMSFKTIFNGSVLIGYSNPNQNYDFPNLSSAIQSMHDCGVCGPVVLNLDSGVYTDKVYLSNIIGIDSINTLTIKSLNDDSSEVILQYNPSNIEYVFEIKNFSNLTISGLTMKTLSTTRHEVLAVRGNNENINITHNRFIGNLLAPNSIYYKTIYFDISKKKNFNISDNRFEKTLGGLSISNSIGGNSDIYIRNNVFDRFKYRAIYVGHVNHVIIENNLIISDSTQSVVDYAISVLNVNDLVLSKNIIQLKPIYNAKGIFLNQVSASQGLRSLFSNNMISISSGTNTMIGIRALYVSNLDIDYNSVFISHGNSNNIALEIKALDYHSPVNIRNNIFYDSLGYTVYYSGFDGTGEVKNNVHFSSGNRLINRISDYNNLDSYRSVWGNETNSWQLKPPFVSSTNLHLKNSSLVGLGVPLSAVTTDIDGQTRSLYASTIGADELPQQMNDLGLVSLIMPMDSIIEGQVIAPLAVIKNVGVSTVSNYSLMQSLNGGSTATQNISSPLLAGEIDTVQLLPFTVTAGDINCCATVNWAADANAFNNSLCKKIYGIAHKDASVTEIIVAPFACGQTHKTIKVQISNKGLDTLNNPAQSSSASVSYRVNDGIVVTENFSQQILANSSVEYTFSTLVYLGTNHLTDSVLSIKAWVDYVGDTHKNNDSSLIYYQTRHTPLSPTANTPVNIPWGAPAFLSAQSPERIMWYDDITSNTILDTGNIYITANNYQKDSFYVAATGGWIGGIVTTGYSTETHSQLPFAPYSSFSYTQSIYYPSELKGVKGKITKLFYSYETLSIPGEAILTIYMGVSNKSNFISEYDWIPVNQLSKVSTDTINLSQGIIELILDNPMDYDGTGNLVIAMTKEPYMVYNAGTIRCTGTNNSRSISYSNNSYVDPTLTDYYYNSLLCYYIPNVTIQMEPSGCQSTRRLIEVVPSAQPANDIGLKKLISPISKMYLTGDENIVVRLQNMGSAAQSQIPIGYKVNYQPVVWDTVSATILPGDSIDFTFSKTANLLNDNQTYHIEVFLSNPADANLYNDSLKVDVTHFSNYCISSASVQAGEDIVSVNVASSVNTSNSDDCIYTDFTSINPFVFLKAGQIVPIAITSSNNNPQFIENCRIQIYIDFNRDGDFYDSNELCFDYLTLPSLTVSGNISVPSNVEIGRSRMRVIIYHENDPYFTGPCSIYYWGETEDYTVALSNPIPNDIGVEEIKRPFKITNSGFDSLFVKVRNFGLDTVYSFSVNYYLNMSSPKSILINQIILPDSAITFFVDSLYFPEGEHSLIAYTMLAGDSNTTNDVSSKTIYGRKIAQLPYYDDFEGANYWIPDTISTQWGRGISQKLILNQAHSPFNVWAVNLYGNYQGNTTDYLYSPLFVLPLQADSVILSFWHNFIYTHLVDGGFIEYRTDNSTWTTLGEMNDSNGINWYTRSTTISDIWNGNSFGWMKSTYFLQLDNPLSPFYHLFGDTIQFRFVFHSYNNNAVNEGWIIDDFELSLAKIAKDGSVVQIVSPSTTTQMNTQVYVTVNIKNNGYLSLDSIPISYQIDSNGWIFDTIFPMTPLLPDSTMLYTFVTPYTSPSNDYSICVRTNLVGDTYFTNDEKCKQVYVNQPTADASLTGLSVVPVFPTDTTKMSIPTYPVVTIKNAGMLPLSSYIVEYTLIGSSNWTSEMVSNPLAPGVSNTFQFNTPFQVPNGAYYIVARVVAPGDVFPSNDFLMKQLVGINDVGIENPNFSSFFLFQNEPNPAADLTIISYQIPNAGMVKFELRNTLGQTIRHEESTQTAGTHNIELDIRSLRNGVYYYTVEYNKQRRTMKMVVSR